MDHKLDVSPQWWGWLLVVGLGLTLTVWGGPTYWPLFFSIVGLMMWAFRIATSHSTHVNPSVLSALKWLAFGAAYYVALRLFFYVYQDSKWNFDPIWPFLLFPLLGIAIVRLRISTRYFWWGVWAASIGACALATYQHFFMGVERAYGFANPIPFGNTSVLLALTCIIGATSANHIRHRFGMLLLMGALAAAYTSLLSGSKGGWLALFMVTLLGIFRYWDAFGRSHPLRFWGALTTVISLGLMLMPSHVTERIFHGIQSGYIYLNGGGVTDGSVSIRFELWRFAWNAFLQSPWLGTPWSELRAQMEVEVGLGFYDPFMLQIYTFDNQYIGALAETGLVGLSSTLVLLVTPVVAFWRFRKSPNTEVRDLASVAIWMAAIFAELGLSASLWGQSMYRQVYVSWLVLLLSLTIWKHK